MQALFLCLKLCLIGKLNSISYSFTSIYFLIYHYQGVSFVQCGMGKGWLMLFNATFNKAVSFIGGRHPEKTTDLPNVTDRCEFGSKNIAIFLCLIV